jgi:hypothetical protein
MQNKLIILQKRLKKIGIEVEYISNIPWIYLRSVNGNVIKKEDWTANHGYTIAFYNWDIEMTDLKKVFKIIRKYKDISFLSLVCTFV